MMMKTVFALSVVASLGPSMAAAYDMTACLTACGSFSATSVTIQTCGGTCATNCGAAATAALDAAAGTQCGTDYAAWTSGTGTDTTTYDMTACLTACGSFSATSATIQTCGGTCATGCGAAAAAALDAAAGTQCSTDYAAWTGTGTGTTTYDGDMTACLTACGPFSAISATIQTCGGTCATGCGAAATAALDAAAGIKCGTDYAAWASGGTAVNPIIAAIGALYPQTPPDLSMMADPSQMCALSTKLEPLLTTLKTAGMSLGAAVALAKTELPADDATAWGLDTLTVPASCLGAPLTTFCMNAGAGQCVAKLGDLGTTVAAAVGAATGMSAAAATLQGDFDAVKVDAAACTTTYTACTEADDVCAAEKKNCVDALGLFPDVSSLTGITAQFVALKGIMAEVNTCFKDGGIDKFAGAGCIPKQAYADFQAEIVKAKAATVAVKFATTLVTTVGADLLGATEKAALAQLGTDADEADAETAEASTSASAADPNTTASSAAAFGPQLALVAAGVLAVVQLF